MPFAVAGAAIGAGVSASGASSAADAAQKQAEAQLAWQKQIYNEAQGNINPYINFGQANIPNYQNALNAYQNAIPSYFDATQQYQNAVNLYPSLQQGYQQAMDKYGNTINQFSNAVPSMTTPYGMSQYQQSPLYTPMVTNLAELQATPGYQMQLQQGLQAINNSAAAKGGLLSGANEMALNNYAQNQAATGFQDAWQRAQTAYGNAFSQNLQGQQQTANVLGQQANLYNVGTNQAGNAANLGQNYAVLQGQVPSLYAGGMNLYNQNVSNYGNAAGVGLTAANNLASVGQNSSISNAYQNLGNANAAAAGAPYAALGQGIGNMGSALGSAYDSGNLSKIGDWFSGIGGGYQTGNGPLSSYQS